MSEEKEIMTLEKIEVNAAGYANAMKMAEEIGKVKMAQSLASGLNLGIIRWFAMMKESKGYKDQVLVDADGNTFITQTFEEFCEKMGFSKNTIYEHLQNFAVLGERYLQEAQEMGLKVRDMRRLRKALKDAPQEKREEIMASLQYARNDSEELKTALDVVCEQYAQSKAENRKLAEKISRLEEDAETAKQDYRAQSEVLQTRNRQYEELKEVYSKATNPGIRDRERLAIEFMEAARKKMDEICNEALITVVKMGGIAEEILQDERADAELKLYVQERVNLAISGMGYNLRQFSYLDVDLEAEFKTPEFMQYNKDYRNKEDNGEE